MTYLSKIEWEEVMDDLVSSDMRNRWLAGDISPDYGPLNTCSKSNHRVILPEQNIQHIMIVMDFLQPDCPDGFILFQTYLGKVLVKTNVFYVHLLEYFIWAIILLALCHKLNQKEVINIHRCFCK